MTAAPILLFKGEPSDIRNFILIHLEQSLDVSCHDVTQVLDLELQMALGMLDDLLNFPIHGFKGVILAVHDAVGSRPHNGFTEKR